MIRRIFTKNYGCLRDIDVHLNGPFQVLVGSNASGKSTFMDTLAFLSDLSSSGLNAAVAKRVTNFDDLVWTQNRALQNEITLGVEIDVSSLLPNETDCPANSVATYTVKILNDEKNGTRIKEESAQLHRPSLPTVKFIRQNNVIEYKIGGMRRHTAEFYYDDQAMFGPANAILAYGPTENRPITKAFNGLNRLLQAQISHIQLNSKNLRRASLPMDRSSNNLLEDGRNLPWLVDRLQSDNSELFDQWVRHLKTTFNNLEKVLFVSSSSTGEATIKIQDTNGNEIPASLMSEGMLRMMALTLPAYLRSDVSQVLLIEEPENGLHPLAIETAFQSLSSVYESHVLVASHSRQLLYCVKPDEVLCFSQRNDGSTQIIQGDKHPGVSDWKSVLDNDQLFRPW